MNVKLTTISIVLFALGSLLIAQPGGMGRRGAKMNPEAKKEIKSYMDKEVLPVVMPERNKLDSYLTAAEQDKLTNIRKDMKSIREQFGSFRKTMMEARRSGEMPSEEQINQMRALGKQQRLLMNDAWAIADEYEIEIYEILDGLKPQSEGWNKDIKAIIEKYKPEGAENGERPTRQRPEGAEGRQGKGQKGRQGGRAGMGPRGGGQPLQRLLTSPVAFLLWDGEADIASTGGQGGFSAFPNPAKDKQTVSYKVKTAGEVIIELMDANGTVVRSLGNAQKEVGEYELDVDTKGLTPGFYIYRITTPDGIKTKKIKIE
ncbi:MAG: T9SS type A sorting domain-containing protein [Bacteroidota bacterium]